MPPSFALVGHNDIGEIRSEFLVFCPFTGRNFSLPRTSVSEELCGLWLEQLAQDPIPVGRSGKMYGLLLARQIDGSLVVLKAFSGLAPPTVDRNFLGIAWAPTIPLQTRPPQEAVTLVRLDELKAEILAKETSADFCKLIQEEAHWDVQQAKLLEQHLGRKKMRDQQRQEERDAYNCSLCDEPDRGLNPERETVRCQESQVDAFELRDFKKAKNRALGHLRRSVIQLRQEIEQLRRTRRQLSRQLQKELHQQFQESLFSQPVYQGWFDRLFPSGARTGVGECCAPKLLHLANKLGLQPVALAEFWWGDEGSRQPGQFYPACLERCQPLLGPLLSSASPPILIHYQDDHLLVVEKPAGLLTVPGRKEEHRDCLWLRLTQLFPEALVVHRLDFEVSGLVVFARRKEAQAHLHRQFEARIPEKVYTALLEMTAPAPQNRTASHGLRPLEDAAAGSSGNPSESIREKYGDTWDLLEGPISAYPDSEGRYYLDPQGKSAQTLWRRLMAETSGGAQKSEAGQSCAATLRVELAPLTGRSHQLRVHCATLLHGPIVGDEKYGAQALQSSRILLHATRLSLNHPADNRRLEWHSPVPF